MGAVGTKRESDNVYLQILGSFVMKHRTRSEDERFRRRESLLFEDLGHL